MDPYHSAFRLLRVLQLSEAPLEVDRLRLLDLYLLFPHLAAGMKLPLKARGWRKRLVRYANPYWFAGDSKLLFEQMKPIHSAALSLLETTGFVERVASGRISIANTTAPIVLDALERNGDDPVAEFLAEVIIPLPLPGPDGLKARSRLLEWRYDET